MTWRTTIIPVAKWTMSWTQNGPGKCVRHDIGASWTIHGETWLVLIRVTWDHGIRVQPAMGLGIEESKSNLWQVHNTLYLVQHRFQIIRLLEHSPRLQCQEPGGDETSAFDHICRDASPGYEGRGRTGTYNEQKKQYCGFSSNWILLYFPLFVRPFVRVSQAWHLTFLTYIKA